VWSWAPGRAVLIVKMLITFVEPIILTRDQFYQLGVSSGVVRIYVGFLSDNINVETIWTLRNWYLRDIRGTIVRKGQINVQMNSYNSFVDLVATGLTPNTVYTFNVENSQTTSSPSATTIISTMDMPATRIKVVNETFRFTGSPIVVGDISITSIGVTPVVAYAAQFPQGWSITRPEGGGLIFSGGQIYAYVPTVIYTRNRSAPAYIDFVPFRGLPSQRIPIYQIPKIQNEGNLRHSIDPPARVRVSWREVVLGSPGSYVNKTHETSMPAKLVDVAQLASSMVVGGVKIVALYE